MTKKIFLGMSAIAMLFATSCQNELDMPIVVGSEATVSFNVATPEIGTRAYGDGTTATVLQYAVYDANGTELIDLRKADGVINGSANVELQLTTGNTYSVVFWADHADAPYNVDFANRRMTVDYEGVVSNNENLDAFYAYHTFTVSGAQQETIILKRPFAQLNIATADLEQSKKAGYEVTQSYVKVPVYDTLNFVDGTVVNQDAETFEWANIPTEKLMVSGNEYGYLAMDYLLVGEKELVEVEFGYRNAANDIKTRTVGSVPVQRNYRTNIYGNLLTSMVDVNISIDPIFNEPAHEAEDLFKAAAFGGEVTLTEDVVLTTPLNVQANMTLNLGGKTLTGAVNVANGVQVTVNNGKIVNTNKEVSGITSNGDLTLNDVEITSARHAIRVESGKAVINGGVYMVAPISKSTLHALNVGDNGTTAEVIIKGGQFIGPKGTMADSGSAVNVRSGSTVAIEGGDFSGGKTKTLANGGTLTVTGGSFDQNPTTFVANGFKAIAKDGKYYVVPEVAEAVATTAEELGAAINEGKATIALTAGTYVIPNSAKGKTLAFVGTGNPEDVKIATNQSGSYEGCNYALDGSTVVFENITITTDGKTYTGYARCNGTYKNCVINNTYTLYGNSVFENCTFNVNGDAYNIWTWGAPIATFNNCTFNCDGKSMLLYGQANTKLTMNYCVFNDKGGLDELKAAIEIGNDYNKSYELIVNNATVNGFAINDKGINTGTTLWANKNSMPQDKLNVVVDGVDVY